MSRPAGVSVMRTQRASAGLPDRVRAAAYQAGDGPAQRLLAEPDDAGQVADPLAAAAAGA
jgi:hypothetical protein